jgi:ADP-ribosylglycohydrolase
MYAKWIESKPFDIGNTTRNTMFKAHEKNPAPTRMRAAAERCETSISNGFLMRISPLAAHLAYIRDVKYE